MKKRNATTKMAYQLESNNGVHESGIRKLATARTLAKDLLQKNVSGVQIARYDAEEKTRYYEIVFTF